jgi:alanyl-tRNA synthetase
LYTELDCEDVETCMLALFEKGSQIMSTYFPEVADRKNILRDFLVKEQANYHKTIKKVTTSIQNFKIRHKIQNLSEQDMEYFYTKYGINKEVIGKIIS